MSRKDRYRPKEPGIEPCGFTATIHEGGGAIYFNIESNYSEVKLFEVIESISELKILKREVIYQSFGPIETREVITTSLGTFNLSSILEGMYDGFTLSSGDVVLLQLIVEKLRSSKLFYQMAG